MEKDKKVFLRVWERPVTVKDLLGATVTMILALAAIIFLVVVLSAAGQQDLLRQANHNAEIAVAESKALRCVLKLRPDPERPYETTQGLIDHCYQDFDKLIKAAEEGGE